MSVVLRWVRTKLGATRCYSCFARMESSQP
jgi:hypothetical protein